MKEEKKCIFASCNKVWLYMFGYSFKFIFLIILEDDTFYKKIKNYVKINFTVMVKSCLIELN